MLFHTELGLPARGVSRRVTQRKTVAPDETLTLFDEAGPGCVLHWWLTYTPGGESAARDRAHDLYLRIFYDGEETPAVEVTLAQFFGILLDRDVYTIHTLDVSAYAVATLHIDTPGSYRMHIGFDDWMTLWVDGNEIYSGRHDAGFREETVTRSLPAGEVELRIKLSNQDNFQWRLWAFSLRLDRG